jgi:mono/diheme cytochrome c family protein
MSRAILLTAALTLAACSARREEPLVGPVPLSTNSVRRGELLFMRECHRCHPHGDAGLGPALNNKPLPGGAVHQQIRRGLGAMPSFSEARLSDEDVNAIVEYVEALRRHRG